MVATVWGWGDKGAIVRGGCGGCCTDDGERVPIHLALGAVPRNRRHSQGPVASPRGSGRGGT
eukprot:1800230-Prorocentrum_lima.AAC.1